MSELKKLENLFTLGKITRREFLRRVSALGLAAAVSPALMSMPARAATPKRGGRFRMGIQGGNISDSLDPATSTNSMPQFMGYLIRNNLVEVDHEMKPIPELAESWDASSDATRWTFKLRKGVEFHNGKTMDSKDVVYSVQHHRSKDSKSAAKAILEDIDEIKADGKYEVSFKLKSGSADFPFLMSDYHVVIFPDGTTNWEDGMGTGGYSVVSWEPGVRMLAKRNPNYWKSDRAHFDEVETIHIADVNARTNAISTNQVDCINRCEKKTYHLLTRKKGVKGIRSAGMKHYTYAMRTDKAPYTDNNVRMAMKYAINREHILKQVMRGYGVPGNDHPISPINRYHNKDLPQRKYDPDKAKFYLKKAGLADQTFDIHVSDEGFPGAVDAAALYKEHAAKAGMNLKIVREPADGYWSDVWLKKPFCAVYWGGRPTEDWMFTSAYAAGAAWNDTYWNNKRFNELLVAARAELDDAKRRKMYYEMQQICSDDGGTLVVAFLEDVMAARENVQYKNLAANWELDGWKAGERWWFA